MADLKDAPRDGTIVMLELGDDVVPARWMDGTHWDLGANAPAGSWVRTTDNGESRHALMPDEPQPSGWSTPDEAIETLRAREAMLIQTNPRAAVDRARAQLAAIQAELAELDAIDPELEQLERWHQRLGGDDRGST